MKKIFISLFVIMYIIFAASGFASAHAGKTDKYGGHYDNETGEYHYHHGYEAHEHINGVCPYDFDDQTNYRTGTSVSDATPKPELHIETPDPLSPIIREENNQNISGNMENKSYDTPEHTAKNKIYNDTQQNNSPLSFKVFAPWILLFILCVLCTLIKKYKNSKITNTTPATEPATPSEPPRPEPVKLLPEGYGIDKNGLPYKLNRQYGWGREFNAFVTQKGHCYHRSKCKALKGKGKIRRVIHRYIALEKGYDPCHYCTPINHIDDWYIKMFPNSPYAKIPPKKYEQISIEDK